MARRFIIQADGGSRGNPGPAAYGVVVRDAATGDVVAEQGEHLGIATNNVAEYRGLIAGLEIVRELDPEASVEVRLDSRLVVEQMSGGWRIKHPDIVPLARRARELLPQGGATWQWVPREQNREADRLVNEALDAARPRAGRALPAAPAQPARLAPAVPVPAYPSPAALAAEFHDAFDLSRQDRPDAGAVPGDVAGLRQRLLEEEVTELRAAVASVDVVGIARELADVVYVAYGTALTYGIDLDVVLAEVHRANMSKLDAQGRPVHREDGKVLKGPQFRAPDVAGVLGLGGDDGGRDDEGRQER